MSRMNSRNRKKFIQLLIKKFGDIYCFIGGEELKVEDAIIDHWDNDNSNNNIENLSFLCGSMNAVKNPRGRDKRHKVLSPICGNAYVQMLETERLKVNSVEIIKNMQAEPDFKHWLFAKVRRDEKVSFEDALDGGAAFARCSQETIRRYLKKEVSEERLYQIKEDPDSKKRMVTLKPRWAIIREKDEVKKNMISVVKNWKEIMNEDVSVRNRRTKEVSLDLSLDNINDQGKK